MYHSQIQEWCACRHRKEYVLCDDASTRYQPGHIQAFDVSFDPGLCHTCQAVQFRTAQSSAAQAMAAQSVATQGMTAQGITAEQRLVLASPRLFELNDSEYKPDRQDDPLASSIRRSDSPVAQDSQNESTAKLNGQGNSSNELFGQNNLFNGLSEQNGSSTVQNG